MKIVYGKAKAYDRYQAFEKADLSLIGKGAIEVDGISCESGLTLGALVRQKLFSGKSQNQECRGLKWMFTQNLKNLVLT